MGIHLHNKFSILGESVHNFPKFLKKTQKTLKMSKNWNFYFPQNCSKCSKIWNLLCKGAFLSNIYSISMKKIWLWSKNVDFLKLLKYKTRVWEKTARQIFFILAFIESLNRVESHGACHRAAHFFLAKIEEMYAVL